MKKITTVLGIITLLTVTSAFAAEGAVQTPPTGSPALSKDSGIVLKKAKKNRKHKKHSKTPAVSETSASPATGTSNTNSSAPVNGASTNTPTSGQ